MNGFKHALAMEKARLSRSETQPTELTQAKVTVMGGEKHGMGEVVVEALLAWIYEGKDGDVYLSAVTDGITRQCCITLPKITNRKGASETTRIMRVGVTYKPTD